MTTCQSQALWELCRQGFPLSADEAERRWSRGEAYHLDFYVKIPRSINTLIEQCNWEIKTAAPAH
jgi:hypothetical protein